MESIASKWRVLSGKNNWDGLLDPLDYDLRRYIIHYGEKAEATSAAFIGEVKSKNVGLPRYPKATLFSKVGLELGNPFKYDVSRYIYASTSGLTENPPKGIAGNSNWLRFLLTKEVRAPTVFGSDSDVRIHHAWYSYYTTAESEYESTSNSTSHSMGAALAVLNATDIVFNGFNKYSTTTAHKVYPVTAIVLACARLEDEGFTKVFSQLENLHVLRVRNLKDIVPDLPPDILGNKYFHVGKGLIIDTTTSP
ncbi:hypothetical protein FEM48_Zijuj04G0176400 [Ziziphus jujuba var. spinosa]|uniref:Phospholipase A1 n=1 Tax=Ziziphus jujuba var. spinosa TaxID=714518 RepID=A0A978VL89_ZIZJJ|nr:hypothetical protein FEM48_Zijuj04G0176400 [Ziziphus jujuba var. spinosa]